MTTQWQAFGCAPIFSSMASLAAAAQAINTRAGAATLPVHLPEVRSPEGMSISTIPTGFIESRAAMAFSGGRFDDVRRFALNAVLVRHPAGDLLFDAGIGHQWSTHRLALPWVMRKTTRVFAGRPAAEQLLAQGYQLDQLSGIVLTHAHWDHISGVQDFPGVAVWISEAEAQFIEGGHRSTKVARGIGPLNLRPFGFQARPYLGFSSSWDVWSDGSVVLVPAPGHTPGSIIVFVTLPCGCRFALIGDIVWQMEGLEQEVEKPWLSRMMADHSPRDVQQLITTLAHLQQTHPSITMIPSHDERAMGALPVWPAAMLRQPVVTPKQTD